MTTNELFFPQPIFSGEEADPPNVPRVLIAPHRYIQGNGVLDHLGRYLSLISSKQAALLIFAEGSEKIGKRIIQSLKQAQVHPVMVTFGGECSHEEVDRVLAILNSEDTPVDCLIAVGGGKCIDTGKNVAHRLSIPVVICPTIASTDAPCSAASVMYTQEGVLKDAEFYPNSPAIVVVDTGVIAEAPVRHLISGMADALATCYETRTCFHNPQARSIVGARITLAAVTIAEVCAKTVFDYGLEAAAAVRHREVNEALERVVEANTLLSGVGFESGGLAAAHAVAGGLTELLTVHENFLHGEMVAIGLLSHLMLEGDLDEAKRVARFMVKLGLPVHLGHLALDPDKDFEVLHEAMAAGMATSPFVHNEPFEVTAEKILTALLQAHKLGLEVTVSIGDAAYREIHLP
jgi:glycerol dehydrogenase